MADGRENIAPIKPLADRIRDGAGGLFMPWKQQADGYNDGQGNPTVPMASMESPEETKARNNLVILDLSQTGLQVTSRTEGVATEFAGLTDKGRKEHSDALQANPNQVRVAEIRYRDAPEGYFPEDSPFWKKDDGKRVVGYVADGQPRYLLDYSNPELQDLLARQAQAAVKSGAVDGVMLDWWGEGENPGRVNLAHKIRDAIGENAVIVVNSNGTLPEKSAPYINGLYMEGEGPVYSEAQAAKVLQWAPTHLDPNLPPITAVEAWGDRKDLPKMREVVTQSLTESNGYFMYGDKDGIPGKQDHGHDLYKFETDAKALGRPTGPLAQPGPGGSVEREFENGTVVFNAPSNGTTHLHFDEERISAATGKRSKDQDVSAGDGDIFLRVSGISQQLKSQGVIPTPDHVSTGVQPGAKDRSAELKR